MKTYLVLVRTDPNAGPEGDMAIYAAKFEVEAEAFEAVKADLPTGWRAVKVIGPATDGLDRVLGLGHGLVERLS